MRLHTKLDYTGVSHALQQAKRAGYVPWDVTFQGGLMPHGSRTHARAFEVQLGTFEKDSLPEGYRDQNGHVMHVRRFKNTGDSGASSEWAAGGNVYAATWDEWGWFIACVFEADPDARFGHYAGYADFMFRTNGKFDLEPTPEYRAASESLDCLPAREHDRRAFGGLLPGEDYRQYDSTEISHDTVREQTGEDA